MDRFVIEGGKKLGGKTRISGSKNAALPILFSSLLTDRECVYTNIPNLIDIRTSLRILKHIGCDYQRVGRKVVINPAITRVNAPYELVRTMRASVLALGPLLAKHGRAKVSLPGGCAIGARPVNIHIAGLKKMGASIRIRQGYIEANAKNGLSGEVVHLDTPSVGATENIMMAATLARGETVIENAAKEPEINDLASALITMGARIEGAGTGRIIIKGVKKLDGANHRVMPDRIELATLLMAVLITGGQIEITGVEPKIIASVLEKLKEAGFKINAGRGYISAKPGVWPPRAVDITTAPYPGFPTDVQAQFMALASISGGTSIIREAIFENRFMHVPELVRLGADISIKGNVATVRGKKCVLNGAPLMATDLRASASLVLAGLAAKGQTTVSRIYHLDRGYEKLENKLSALGAVIRRERDE